MKVMLVDDERLALMQLDKMLKEFGVDVLGSFMNPVEAVAEAGILQPDVVFLDIHMPELYGMEAAEAIQECCPSAEIVFITAYDEYAVKAFELNALDYLLKPLQRDRLERTIQRWRMRHTAEPAAEPADSLPLFCCFPNMRVERPGRGPELIKWRTSKAQELFAYLFHHRGQLVRKSTLLDLLWPATDERKANTHLYTTIYQIRQCLKQAGLHMPIHSIGMKEGYMLDVSHVRIDAEEWERQLTEAGALHERNLARHRELLGLYKGDYLGDYDYHWAENERLRLRQLWLQHAMRLGDYYTRQGLLGEAITVYNRIQRQHPYAEESYFELMKLYGQLDNRGAVDEQYLRLKQVLEQELGLSPRPEIDEWYNAWKRQRG